MSQRMGWERSNFLNEFMEKMSCSKEKLLILKKKGKIEMFQVY